MNIRLSTIVFVIFSLLIAAAFIQSSYAQKTNTYPIGSIVKIQGDVFSNGDTSKRAMRENDPVFMGSHIETADAARALIVFIDDTQVTLGENADFTIDEYVFDPYDADENSGSFSITKGAMQWVSGMLSARETPDIAIQTPQGSIGIRGTAFWVGEIAEGYGAFVKKGRIGFEGDWGSADLFANDGIYITPENPTEVNNTFWKDPQKAVAEQKVAFSGLSAEGLQGAIQNIRITCVPIKAARNTASPFARRKWKKNSLRL